MEMKSGHLARPALDISAWIRGIKSQVMSHFRGHQRRDAAHCNKGRKVGSAIAVQGRIRRRKVCIQSPTRCQREKQNLRSRRSLNTTLTLHSVSSQIVLPIKYGPTSRLLSVPSNTGPVPPHLSLKLEHTEDVSGIEHFPTVGAYP